MPNTAAPHLSPAPEADPGGSCPPAIFTEAILATGRAVRVRRVTTAEYLGAKERALSTAATKGLPPEAVNARVASALDRELIALALVAYTEVRPWEEELTRQHREHVERYSTPEEVARLAEAKLPVPPFVPDVDAALASVAPSEWVPVRPVDLLMGDRSVERLFNDVAEYQGLVTVVGNTLLPAVDLKGLVGKSRTATL